MTDEVKDEPFPMPNPDRIEPARSGDAQRPPDGPSAEMPETCTPARPPQTARLVLTLLLAVLALQVVAGMWGKSATYDERKYLGLGKYLLKYRRWNMDRTIYHPPLTYYLHAAPFFAFGWDFKADASSRVQIRAARLCVLPLAALLALYVFRWASELYGQRAGLLAAFLCAFCPNILAHAGLITADVAVTCFLFITVYYFRGLSAVHRHAQESRFSENIFPIRRIQGQARHEVHEELEAHEERRRAQGIAVPLRALRGFLRGLRVLRVGSFGCGYAALGFTVHGFRFMVYAGLAFGLALLSKYTAVFFVPILALLLLAGLAARKWPSPRRVLLHTALALLLALFILNLGYGFKGTFRAPGSGEFKSALFGELGRSRLVRTALVLLPEPFVRGMDFQQHESERAGETYLMGQVRPGGCWNYFLVAFLVKASVPFLILLVWAGISLARPKAALTWNEAFLLVPPLFFFLYMSLLNDLNIGLRYVLPAFPFLFVFA
ncbi:MAG: glycosyltransferase family 39 protein, partial [Planctomycetes bacterium]|nr:glycosyltransferase family 39 protein [Planctomycetota bacterium]